MSGVQGQGGPVSQGPGSRVGWEGWDPVTQMSQTAILLTLPLTHVLGLLIHGLCPSLGV